MAPDADIVVVFEDRRARGILRLLKAGWRHCFCVVRRTHGWVVVDPLKQAIVIESIQEDVLPGFLDQLRGFGCSILVGSTISAPAAPSLLRPLTCVEIAKRLIGLENWWILTPYQLFRRLLASDGRRIFFRTYE